MRLIGRKHTALVVLATMVGLSLTGPAHAGKPATTDAPDGNITVEVVAANGSGCAPGTATVVSEPDRSGFRVRYSDFIAVAGGGDTTNTRKNCQVAVLVSVPSGWTLAVAQADYRGHASVRAGATGLHRTNYYWQGSSEDNTADRHFTGPVSGVWRNSDVTPVLAYQPCGAQRVLNINTELRISEGTSVGRSFLSMRSSEGDVDTLFNFKWKRC